MSLRNLTIQDEYRSDGFDLIRDFYIPCLENATVYKRAVGFFSSTSMAAAAKGLTALIRAGGTMLRRCHNRWLVRDATSLIATFKYCRSVTHPTEKICQLRKSCGTYFSLFFRGGNLPLPKEILQKYRWQSHFFGFYKFAIKAHSFIFNASCFSNFAAKFRPFKVIVHST